MVQDSSLCFVDRIDCSFRNGSSVLDGRYGDDCFILSVILDALRGGF